MEGYAASAPVSPNVSPSKQALPFTRTLPFKSAKDTLREVHMSLPNRGNARTVSANKRKLAMLEEVDGDASDFDDELDTAGHSHIALDAQEAHHAHMLRSQSMHARPMKPLRGTRPMGTRSLPAAAIHNVLGISQSSDTMEDWSHANFPDARS